MNAYTKPAIGASDIEKLLALYRRCYGDIEEFSPYGDHVLAMHRSGGYLVGQSESELIAACLEFVRKLAAPACGGSSHVLR